MVPIRRIVPVQRPRIVFGEELPNRREIDRTARETPLGHEGGEDSAVGGQQIDFGGRIHRHDAIRQLAQRRPIHAIAVEERHLVGHVHGDARIQALGHLGVIAFGNLGQQTDEDRGE